LLLNNTIFYFNSFLKYGVNAKALHWKNQYTQYKRFEVIISLILANIQQSVIIDAGCGFGDLYLYLQQ